MLALFTFLAAHSDAIIQAGGILGGVALWGYHKLRGDQTQSFRTLITGAIQSLAMEAIAQWVPGGTLADGLSYARQYAEDRIWMVLQKRDVPRNSLTESLVHEAVESVVGKLGNMIAAKLLPAQVSALPVAVAQVKSAFTVDPNTPIAKAAAEIGAMVERVPPDAPPTSVDTPAPIATMLVK